MAIHTLAFPYDKFRGAVKDLIQASGMVLFDTPKGGNVSRRYVTPANPQTSQQTLWRGYLTTAATAYQALTKSQAAAWSSAAEALTETNVLGIDYELSGIALYVRLNAYRLANLQTQVSTPPAIAPPAGTIDEASISLTYNSAVPAANLSFDTTGFADGVLAFYRIARALGSQARNARPNEYRVQTTAPNEAFSAVATNAIDKDIVGSDLISAPTATERVGLEVQFLSADYVPGTLLRFPNIPLTYS